MKNMKQRLSALSALLFALLMSLGLTASASDELKVHFLNVGQADSTLITIGDHAMLIDAGNNDDDEPILNYIQNKQGLSHLDYVIGTHPHEDHIGAMDSVLDAVSVDTVMMPDVTANTKTFLDVLDAIDRNDLGITVPEPGQVYSLGDAEFTILGPVKDYGDNLNDWSIALRLTYENTSFLFTGDAEYDAEADILASGANVDADVYQVGHHGSHSSSSLALLDAAAPHYAVISCGENNDYGHPHRETLDALNSYGIKTYRTDQEGTIVAVSDGKTVTVSQASLYNGGFAPVSSDENISAPDSASDPIVHITKTGQKYHSAGCRYLSKSDIEVTLSDAKSRGLGPRSKCSPPR